MYMCVRVIDQESEQLWKHRVHKTKNKVKQKHNTICVGHHDTQTNTKQINKTCVLLQTTGGKDESNIVFMWKL
jgi:hypothetical protein